MGLNVGMVVTGKVTGIKKFGAFVTLEDGKSGLVHISEVANTYVEDISDHLTDGQVVKVKVLAIDENGRINLSIKKAEEPDRRSAYQREDRYGHGQRWSGEPQSKGESSFEDKLKQFMQESNSKFAGVEALSGKRGSSRRRSRG